MLNQEYDLLASHILEDIINEGYANTLEEAFEVLESFSDYEIGEIAENYLVEDTEVVDLYDVILSHLLDEGFADTEESATVIMANMSEEWRESIVEAKVDEKLPEHKRSGARIERYDNPSGALELGGGQQRARREEHKERRGKKVKV